MKKVLIITYYWPPSGGSGVQRWMYFCQYLADFGYEPIVLTVSDKSASYKNYDESFLKRVENIKTYKADSVEVLKFYSLITTGNSRKGIPQGNIQGKKKSIVNKLFTYVRGNLFIPDARIGWVNKAIKKAQEIIDLEKIDLVVTTGPPHSTHLIGRNLKKKNKLNWVADFRDPWTDIFYNKDLLQGSRAKKRNAALEKEVLENADRILTIGFKLKELLQQKIKGQKEKFYHIYNGYDSFLMDKIEVEKQDKFEVTFIGLLTDNQPYKSFVNTLKQFLNKNKEAKISICLAGNIQEEIIAYFQKEIPQADFDLQGYISHEKALSLMKRSNLLVNVLSSMKQSEILISGKQMEYVATGNPILCFGNTQGESAIILKEIDNAAVFEENDTEKAELFIEKVYQKWVKKEDFVNEITDQNILNKSRYETTRELAHFFNEILD